MRVLVRAATEDDLPRIFQIERRSYPSPLWAPPEILRSRFRLFGIWVAEFDGTVAGFFTCVPVFLDWPRPDLSQVLKNRKPHYKPWFELYSSSGCFNTLFVTSTAVESCFQKKGIGTALVNYSLDLAREQNFHFRASALRCQCRDESVDSYLAGVRSGEIIDRFLSLYLRLGFQLGQALPGYEPNKGSSNFNVFAYKEV